MGANRIHRIDCGGHWMYVRQPLRFQGGVPGCAVSGLPFACDGGGRLDAGVPIAPANQTGF